MRKPFFGELLILTDEQLQTTLANDEFRESDLDGHARMGVGIAVVSLNNRCPETAINALRVALACSSELARRERERYGAGLAEAQV